jgi:hypothetical protein
MFSRISGQRWTEKCFFLFFFINVTVQDLANDKEVSRQFHRGGSGSSSGHSM